MATAHQEWTVLDHRPIQRLEENLWCVTGSLPGMALKRVMTLVRLDDGRIVIHSAVALDSEQFQEPSAPVMCPWKSGPLICTHHQRYR